MGSGASRAAARPAAAAAVEAAAAPPVRTRAEAALERLPAGSAVRRDAERAVQYHEWRVAQVRAL